MNLRLHQLEGFYYTGKAGGYAAAARAIPYPISEPAIYQQVRKLEQTLGISLCVQAAARKTVLTPEGRVLHAFVAPFFEGLAGVVRAIGEDSAAQLVIAAEGSIALDLLVPAVASLRRDNPLISVRLADRSAAEVARMVAAGEADAGVAIIGLGQGPLREIPLLSVRIALCAPRDHPLAQRNQPPELAELDGMPLCVYERGQPGREMIEAIFREAGIRLRIAAEASSLETLSALVRAGVGPAFVPMALPEGGETRESWSEQGLKAFDITGMLPGEPITYGLLRRIGAPKHRALEALIALLVA